MDINVVNLSWVPCTVISQLLASLDDSQCLPGGLLTRKWRESGISGECSASFCVTLDVKAAVVVTWPPMHRCLAYSQCNVVMLCLHYTALQDTRGSSRHSSEPQHPTLHPAQSWLKTCNLWRCGGEYLAMVIITLAPECLGDPLRKLIMIYEVVGQTYYTFQTIIHLWQRSQTKHRLKMITGWSWSGSAPEVEAGRALASAGPRLPVSSAETGEGSRRVPRPLHTWWPAMTWDWERHWGLSSE